MEANNSTEVKTGQLIMKPNSNRRYNTNSSNFNRAKKGGEGSAIELVIEPHQPIQAKPLEIIVRDHDNVERCIRSFRSMVQKERILSDYKERQSYEKPSDKKRRKIGEYKRNQLEACSKGECNHSEHVGNKRTRKPRKD